jgi:hypothetical protein
LISGSSQLSVAVLDVHVPASDMICLLSCCLCFGRSPGLLLRPAVHETDVCCLPASNPVQPLAAQLDVPHLLQPGAADAAAPAELLQLLSDTADACQATLTAATAAAEPQGLIQAYARLQQMQGRSIAVPAGAPASLAVTSKVLTIIESLSVAPAAAIGPGVATPAVAAAGAAAVKPTSAGGKAAADKTAAASPVSKAEQVR